VTTSQLPWGQPVIFSATIFDKVHSHEHVAFMLVSCMWILVRSGEEQCDL